MIQFQGGGGKLALAEELKSWRCATTADRAGDEVNDLARRILERDAELPQSGRRKDR